MADNIKLEDFSIGNDQTKTDDMLSTIGIVGSGRMGKELISYFSQKGFEVRFLDLTDETIEDTYNKITATLDAKIAHWGLTESEKRGIMSRIKGSSDYKIFSKCDIVIEAINTNTKTTSINIRQEVFKKIEEHVCDNCIIASNTSTLMISDLSEDINKPERTLGLHFIAPVDDVKIVEIVKHAKTSDKAYNTGIKFINMINRTPIHVNESAGNIATRMTVPMINEACNIFMEGIASPSDIDKAMKASFGYQYGPFELADKIGLDKVLRWMDNLYQEFSEQKYKASPIIKRLVRANHLGRKTEIGFYRYKNNTIVEQAVTCAQINNKQ